MQRTIQKKLFSNLAVLCSTLLLLFLAGEVFARFYFSKSIATNESLKIYQNSTSVTWEHKPDANATHGPGDPPPEIHINNYGMRGPNITLEKPANTRRILLLGDSFTFGMIVDQEKIFSHLLEKKLNDELTPLTGKNYGVLNFGTIGYTTDQQYLQLQEKGLQFKPDIVVVNFFAGNDPSEFRRHELEVDENGELKKVIDVLHFVDENGELRRRGVGKPNLYFIALIRERGKVLLNRLGMELQQPRLLWSNFLPPDHSAGDPDIFTYFQKAEQMLLAIKNLNEQNGIQTLVTIIPADFQVNSKYLSKYPGNPANAPGFEMTRPQNLIGEFNASNNIPTLDLLPIFQKDENDIYFTQNDPHFSEYGHEKMAEILFKTMYDILGPAS